MNGLAKVCCASVCNLELLEDINNANKKMESGPSFSRSSCTFATDNALFFLHRASWQNFRPVFDGTSADSFHDVDKTADEEFLFPRVSRDERKCRRAAIDPARAAPAPDANQSAIHYHLRPTTYDALIVQSEPCA